MHTVRDRKRGDIDVIIMPFIIDKGLILGDRVKTRILTTNYLTTTLQAYLLLFFKRRIAGLIFPHSDLSRVPLL